MDKPERKNTHECRDLLKRKQDIIEGNIPVPLQYPYVTPDYNQKFVHIGTDKQLFLDNYILDYFYDVKRERCKPEVYPSLVMDTREKPWEKNGASKSRVLYDEKDKKYKMWYVVSLEKIPHSMAQAVCYAESNDGINWVKPVVEGCVPYKDIKDTNILFVGCRHFDVIRMPEGIGKGRFAFSYCDTLEMTKPESKNSYNNAVLSYSDDGIKWEIDGINTETPRHHEASTVYDRDLEMFVSYAQMSHHGNWITRKRQISRTTSKDLLHWTPNDVVFSFQNNGNVGPNYEAHSFSAHMVGSLYVGLVDIARTEPLWQVGGNSNWRDVFHLYTTLVTSRDGINWNMLGDVEDPWLPNGKPGSVNYGYRGFNSTPAYAGDYQYIYHYTSPFKQFSSPHNRNFHVPYDDFRNNYNPGNRPQDSWPGTEDEELISQFESKPKNPAVNNLTGGIGLVKMRKDRYTAIRPIYEEGAVLTTQFVFEGNRLELNADAKFGCIKVEVLDHTMKPYEGFGRDDCDAVFGDYTDKTVTWNGNADVSGLWNKPIRLLFYLNEASIYSFRFYYAD